MPPWQGRTLSNLLHESQESEYKPGAASLLRHRAGRSATRKVRRDNILALVHVFSNLIGQAFYGSLEVRHHLSVHQWRILLTLAHHPGATAVDIIARWALQPMSVSRAIRELAAMWLDRPARRIE